MVMEGKDAKVGMVDAGAVEKEMAMHVEKM